LASTEQEEREGEPQTGQEEEEATTGVSQLQVCGRSHPGTGRRGGPRGAAIFQDAEGGEGHAIEGEGAKDG
jgi:hypothetical protein